MSLFAPLSLTSVDFFLVPTTLTVATVCGHTAAGSTVAIRENDAGFSLRSTVRKIATAMTPKAKAAKRVQTLRHWTLPVLTLLSIKSRSRSQ